MKFVPKFWLLGVALFTLSAVAADPETVGHSSPDRLVTPVNQIVTPAGKTLELPRLRPQALALSPDGNLLVTAGLTHELVVISPATGTIVQRVPFPSDRVQPATPVSKLILHPDPRAELSFTGLAFSPDGTRLYLANVNGDVKVFGVGPDRQIRPLFSLALPPAGAPGRQAEIPAGLAVSADGKKIYVAGNLSNRLLELDAATGRVLRTWEVGVAPFAVVRGQNKIYVSNWGGRRPGADSVTGPAGQGTRVRVDARSIASEGSVTVIDLGRANQSEILTGLHTSALALSPDGRYVVAANTGSDTLSVIDARTDKIVDTICARQNPGDLFGAQPDALAFDRSGKKLFAANATQNAVAVFQFKSPAPLLGLIPWHRFVPGRAKMQGLIPAGWFPAALAFDAKHHQICVANLKDITPNSTPKTERVRPGAGGAGFNSRQYCGTLSLIPLPAKKALAAFTRTALADLRYPLLAQAKLPPRPGRPAVPVPERVGEPSVFKHVIYIIKENRTYDQVLGDVRAGNGEASLCTYGARVTPNQHGLAQDFVLLDNTYCAGILSADGHQWTDSAMATDYVEREFAGWPRSYPCGGEGTTGRDALAYSPAGFIWDDARANGRKVVNFGEFTSARPKRWKDPTRRGKIHFAETWQDFITGANGIEYGCDPDIEALRPFSVTNYVGWDLELPDVWRAAFFCRALKEYEKNDNLPDFILLYLPNDHTSGTAAGRPTPAAQVADNDLAMGRIVEALSHSKFWKDTCLFAIEDDPQDGWDHVSGYRTTAYVASAYTRRHTVVSTQYNQTSLLRTLELMLGLPPMNQMDATATPMFDCFTNTPDFTAFDAVTNQVPLDEMNPAPKRIADAQLRRDALVSARLPLAQPDQCPEEVLNAILWRAAKGPQTPFPAWAVKIGDED